MTAPIHIIRRYGRGIIGYRDTEDGHRVVAVLGTNNDWAAYEGPGSMDNPMEIAQRGSKLSARAAARLFPFLKSESYRP